MKYKIAIPYFPGSNGDYDVINILQKYNMDPTPLYFHIGDINRLQENSKILKNCDGAVLPGGFPYEDRLGFGHIPSKITQYVDALKYLSQNNKPIIAFCSGNQIIHKINLISNNIKLDYNTCQNNNKIKYTDFLDKQVYIKLCCPPDRTAFTRYYNPQQIISSIISHGGGKLITTKNTLENLMKNGMIVTRYCNQNGNIINHFPINPNGSMLNIESLCNINGNVMAGMVHHERQINSLKLDASNIVFQSMKDYLDEGCPNLYLNHKKQNYKFKILHENKSIIPDVIIYIKLLTDDNEQMMVKLFTGLDVKRYKLLCIKLNSTKNIKQIIKKIYEKDLYDAIMLKKDFPIFIYKNQKFEYRTINNKRQFIEINSINQNFPIELKIIEDNIKGEILKKTLNIDLISNISIGTSWFCKNQDDMEKLQKFLKNEVQ